MPLLRLLLIAMLTTFAINATADLIGVLRLLSSPQ